MSIVSGSLMIGIALVVASPVAAAGALDQHQDVVANAAMTPGGMVGMGQTFTAHITGNLDQVAVYVGLGPAAPQVAPAKIGGQPQAPGDNIVVFIRQTVGGAPDPSNADNLADMTAQAPSLNFSWVVVPVTPPVHVVAGQVYAIGVLTPNTEASLGWGGSCGANPYAGGAPFSFNPTTYSALNANGIDTCVQDLAFRTYVTRNATPPPTGAAEPTTPAPANQLPLIFAAFAVGAAFVTVRKAAEARRWF